MSDEEYRILALVRLRGDPVSRANFDVIVERLRELIMSPAHDRQSAVLAAAAQVATELAVADSRLLN